MSAEQKSPQQLFQSYAEEGDALEQHHKWLDCIRDCSWEKVNDEAEVMPTNDAHYPTGSNVVGCPNYGLRQLNNMYNTLN